MEQYHGVMGQSGESAAVYRLQEPPVEELCRSAECAASDGQLTTLVVAVGVGGIALVLGFLYLARAASACNTEADRLRAERDAFERFGRKVAELDPGKRRSVGPSPVGSTAVVSTGGGTDQHRRVRQLYGKTVMGVDHYDEEYGEPMNRHCAAELGEQAAHVLTGDGRLSTGEQQLLVGAAGDARRRRQRLLKAVTTERETIHEASELLEPANDTIEPVEHDLRLIEFDELRRRWEQLDEAEQSCSRLLDDRQGRLQSGVAVAGGRWDGFKFCSYLYGELSVRHPVLASGATVLDRLRTRKGAVVRALTARV